MKFTADVEVMPLPEILDPQGKAVLLGLGHLAISGVADVRVGRHIRLELDAPDQPTAEAIVEQACQKLLANPIMEGYTYRVVRM